jgi:hypothetical protein
MNSTPGPKAAEPRDASIAGTDERLAHAYKQIVSADEQLARLSEQVARMERNAGRARSAGVGWKSARGRRPLGALFGLALASCFIVAALVWQWSIGGAAGPVADASPPQLALAASLPPENPPLPVEPAPSAVHLAAADAAPAQATPAVQTAPPATPVAEAAPQATAVAETAPQAAVVAQAASQDAAPTAAGPTVPTAAAASPDHAQLLQTMARDLANLQGSIEQLKATQQKTASDTAKEIAEIKASQEEMKRALAKGSEQNPPRTSPPPAQSTQTTQPAPALRKPERTVQSPRERARPRFRRDWYYDDW